MWMSGICERNVMLCFKPDGFLFPSMAVSLTEKKITSIKTVVVA